MAEEGAVADVAIVLVGEFSKNFCAAFRIGTVVLGNDFERPAVDAAGIVDGLGGGLSGAVVSAAVSRADACAVDLEANAHRLGRLRLGIAHEARQPAS